MAEADMKEKLPDGSAAREAEVVQTEYMRITMNSEPFLIPVAAVLSIIRPTPLTPVLMAPAHLMGLANIRGQIFCMIDPGKALGLPHARKEETSSARFLLLRHARVNLGIWVEEVVGLHSVQAPDEQEGKSHAYEIGRVDTKHGTVPILRVEALFD